MLYEIKIITVKVLFVHFSVEIAFLYALKKSFRKGKILKMCPEIACSQAGTKVCGDERSLDDDGRPLASVRASLGYPNTVEDVQALAAMIYDCFVQKDNNSTFEALVASVEMPHNLQPKDEGEIEREEAIVNGNGMTTISIKEHIIKSSPVNRPYAIPEQPIVHSLYIYPVKSARACKLENVHPLCATGLAYDRLWMVSDKNGAI